MDDLSKNPDPIVTNSSCPDFPEGGIGIAEFKTESMVTDRVCEECNGTRAKLTHMFRITNITFVVGGETMDLQRLCELYPQSGAWMSKGLNVGEFTNPTCTACQEDMRTRAKELFGY